MSRMTRSVIVVVGVLLLALTGCSLGKEAEGEPLGQQSASPSAPASASVDEGSISPPLKELPTVTKPKGAIKALTLEECSMGAGGQSVKGSITSIAKQQADYLVTVSWTTSDHDVMGRGFAVLSDVDPGETVDFTIKAKVKEGASLCVPGVVYGTIEP